MADIEDIERSRQSAEIVDGSLAGKKHSEVVGQPVETLYRAREAEDLDVLEVLVQVRRETPPRGRLGFEIATGAGASNREEETGCNDSPKEENPSPKAKQGKGWNSHDDATHRR